MKDIEKRRKPQGRMQGRMQSRMRNTIKLTQRYQFPKEGVDYKNVPLLQKFITDRGKIVPRRISGITTKEQRQLTRAIKLARFLALLPTGTVQR